MDYIFQALKPLVWPKFREEGPPDFIQDILSGHALTGEGFTENPTAMSILELWTVGYRPVTTFAILSVLARSSRALHGMEIAKELEKQFELKEPWFTKTRYYTDRVGKVLIALSRLRVLQDSDKEDAKTGKTSKHYQISPTLTSSAKETLRGLSQGQHVSLFLGNVTRQIPQVKAEDLKQCFDHGVVSDSPRAKYCEECGKSLKAKCEKCNATVDVVYEYCTSCGNKKTKMQ